MQFTQANWGRIFILRLHDGDHLPNVLEDFAEDQRIDNAFCFFLGGVKHDCRVVVGPKDGDTFPPQPITTLLRGVHEAAGVGTLFRNEQRKPKLHMHAAFGREEKTITGCVRMGVDVWQIGEVLVLELTNAKALRKIDEKTGFEFLEVC